MSGLVFVQDAQGRPLMPTSPAYARTLLHKRKAQRTPHPTFNIIQLTSIISEPELRPVVVSILLYHRTAYLTLLTEHLRGAISSLSMIIDLTAPNHVHRFRSTDWRPSSRRGYSSTFKPQTCATNITTIRISVMVQSQLKLMS
jgi:hypothetical protein